MGITSDIGEDVLAIANEVCDNDIPDYMFGWCYEHDSNILVGWCACCPAGEGGFPEVGPLWRFMLRRRIQQWLDEGEDPR